MAGTKEIKRRIKSVKNTKKITKAMELVAASKMKRAVSATLSSRAYAEYSWEIFKSLSEMIDSGVTHPLLETREVKKVLVVLVTSNRGLCGSYNSQSIKKAMELIKSDTGAGHEIVFITVGKKGDTAMRRLGQNIIASFTEIPDSVTLRDVFPIANLAMDMFKNKAVDRVVVCYTDFFSALLQKPRIRALLPVSRRDIQKAMEVGTFEASHGQHTSTDREEVSVKNKTEYTFEPGYETLMPLLIEKLSRAQIYHMLLESIASEQSSRMVAMKNASDAAGEMIDDLTLVFNKARQSLITQEISEISAGMASIN